jgi:hypothetical protein
VPRVRSTACQPSQYSLLGFSEPQLSVPAKVGYKLPAFRLPLYRGTSGQSPSIFNFRTQGNLSHNPQLVQKCFSKRARSCISVRHRSSPCLNAHEIQPCRLICALTGSLYKYKTLICVLPRLEALGIMKIIILAMLSPRHL